MTQKEALKILKTGANVFLTGEPGAGKTHTINEYVRYLRACKIEPAITASTGIAATHIDGMTIHSWSGIGIAEKLSPEDVLMIVGRSKIRKRILNTWVLIIDEVSMLASSTLSMVDTVCRGVRQINEPFGGLQVVLVGDFFQLPPVSRNGAKTSFAYESDAWNGLNPVVCYLTEQYRQDDPLFLSALSSIRENNCDFSMQAHILACTSKFDDVPGNIPKLFPHNVDVDRINSEKLAKLTGDPHEFHMHSSGPALLVEGLKKSCLSPEKLILKKGASVMFTKNSPQERFVNGTLGVVSGFDSDSGYPVVRKKNGGQIIAEPMDWTVEEGGKIRAKVVQIPLRLAWAMTVHKSQGMSMDAAVVDLSDAFEYGQGYVALSRVRRLSGLYLLGANERAFAVHPEVAAKDKEFRAASAKNSKFLLLLSPTEIQDKHEYFIKKCEGKKQEFPITTMESDKKGWNPRRAKNQKWTQTYDLIKKGYSIEEIAKMSGKSVGTIFKHVEELLGANKLLLDDIRHLQRSKEKNIFEAHCLFKTLGSDRLKPIFEGLGGRVSYDTIRLAKFFYKLK